MVILGLDPGSRHTGYGLIEAHGDELRPLAYGRISAAPRLPVAERLGRLAQGLLELTETWQPGAAAMETVFHGINSRSLIVLAQARGALLATLAQGAIEVREYTPAQVKSAVSGSGRADKQQVARMVALILALSDRKASTDATDALAVAICCAHRYRLDRLTAGDSP